MFHSKPGGDCVIQTSKLQYFRIAQQHPMNQDKIRIEHYLEPLKMHFVLYLKGTSMGLLYSSSATFYQNIKFFSLCGVKSTRCKFSLRLLEKFPGWPAIHFGLFFATLFAYTGNNLFCCIRLLTYSNYSRKNSVQLTGLYLQQQVSFVSNAYYWLTQFMLN